MSTKYTINNSIQDDIKDVLNLSNDKLVRCNSINTTPISWEEHVEWFNKRVVSSLPFYIIRPSNGLHPKYYESVIVKVSNKDLSFGTPLSVDDF